MFSLNFKKNQTNPEEQRTVIIRGGINGSIQRAEKVIVAKSGHFQGTIVASSIEVYGELSGSIECNNIEVFPTGQLRCENMKYQNIVVHDGALVLQNTDRQAFVSNTSFKNTEPGGNSGSPEESPKKAPDPTIEINNNDKDTTHPEDPGGPIFYTSV